MSETSTLQIGEPEQPTISVNDATVCTGTTSIPITFTADCPVEHFLVEYDDAANAAGLVDMNTNGSAIGAEYMLPANLPAGTYNGTALVVCENFCNDLDPFTITVVDNPEIALTQTEACLDEGLSFIAAPTGLSDYTFCLLYTSPSPRDATLSRMPSSA